MDGQGRQSQALPALAAGCYLAAGLAWIWWSDEAGRLVFTSVDDFARYEAIKGFGFVLVTALALYLGILAGGRAALRRDSRIREEAQQELARLNAQLELRIYERTQDLEAANRALESFTYSVAHDLRTPVAHVDGFAKALEDTIRKRDPERAWHYTQRIVANARLMSEMIEGLLHVSRADRAAVERERVDMDRLVHEVIEELAPDERVAIAVGPLPETQCDRALVHQVWSNLISNAVKYSAKGEAPRVSVSASDRDAEHVFCVQDNGVGFEPAEAERLFTAFQRLSNAHSFAGSGVGLAIVKRIVERHGGRVWAVGEPAVGASFFFSLPA